MHSRLRALCVAALFLVPSCTQTKTSTTATRDDAAPNASAAPAARAGRSPATQPMDAVIARIRVEGLTNSKVMDTLDYLCDVIGQRLTGSPSAKHANEWTRDTLSSWGLSNAHLESWGPFGRGWVLKRFSLQIVEPYTIVLNGYPKAWSPGFDAPIEAPVVYIDATKMDDLDKFKGKLKGAIVLLGATRDVLPRFDPLAARMDDAALQKLADAKIGTSALMGQSRDTTAAERRAQFAESGALGEALANRNRRGGNPPGDASGGAPRDTSPTTEPSASNSDFNSARATTGPTSRPGGRRGFDPFASRALKFVTDEGAALVVTPSSQGDGGTYFVQSASIPGDNPRGGGGGGGGGATTRPRVWSTDAPKIPAQVMLAVEDYNRVARMAQRGTPLRAAADLQVQFVDDDAMAYNTIAEIPGTDPKLKDEIVMVGAHMDSWHSGTGATDNGVGSAAAMEAIRILKALDLKPRRTIRVALWTGEEQGIYGSAAYVKQHFGYEPEQPRRTPPNRDAVPTTGPTVSSTGTPTTRSGADLEPEGGRDNPATQPAGPRRPRNVIKGADYEKLSAYFNLDNGTGKIRGIYAQGNEAAVPLFKKWLEPFADLGAKTVTISNTGSTDHISFDQIGLPGFQFIQDPIEYGSRTHHSNEDVYDRAQAGDLKQASTIMAAFLWNTANLDERFPRKPLDPPTTSPSRER